MQQAIAKLQRMLRFASSRFVRRAFNLEGGKFKAKENSRRLVFPDIPLSPSR